MAKHLAHHQHQLVALSTRASSGRPLSINELLCGPNASIMSISRSPSAVPKWVSADCLPEKAVPHERSRLPSHFLMSLHTYVAVQGLGFRVWGLGFGV